MVWKIFINTDYFMWRAYFGVRKFRLIKQGGGPSCRDARRYVEVVCSDLDRLRLRLEEDVSGEKTIYARIVMDLLLR